MKNIFFNIIMTLTICTGITECVFYRGTIYVRERLSKKQIYTHQYVILLSDAPCYGFSENILHLNNMAKLIHTYTNHYSNQMCVIAEDKISYVGTNRDIAINCFKKAGYVRQDDDLMEEQISPLYYLTTLSKLNGIQTFNVEHRIIRSAYLSQIVFNNKQVNDENKVSLLSWTSIVSEAKDGLAVLLKIKEIIDHGYKNRSLIKDPSALNDVLLIKTYIDEHFNEVIEFFDKNDYDEVKDNIRKLWHIDEKILRVRALYSILNADQDRAIVAMHGRHIEAIEPILLKAGFAQWCNVGDEAGLSTYTEEFDENITLAELSSRLGKELKPLADRFFENIALKKMKQNIKI